MDDRAQFVQYQASKEVLEDASRGLLRKKILRGHLERASLPTSNAVNNKVAHHIGERLGHAFALDVVDRLTLDVSSRSGLSSGNLEQVVRAGPLRRNALDVLNELLIKTLKDIAVFFLCDPSVTVEDLISSPSRLSDELDLKQQSLQEKNQELYHLQGQVIKSVDLANEMERRLRDALIEQATVLPAPLQTQNSAKQDLAALTIETSLLKLSLMRARTYSTLYGFRSPQESHKDMPFALSRLDASLREEKTQLDAEQRSCHKKLVEYEKVVAVVTGGGYAQVVEDWKNVAKETEETRRDLRRLGFSDDD